MDRIKWWAGLALVHLIVVTLLILLSGCGFTPQGDALRATLREKGKAVAAESLDNSEWFMCRAASVGSVKDRYGVSMEKVIAYNSICKTDPKFTPILPLQVPDIIKEEVEPDIES